MPSRTHTIARVPIVALLATVGIVACRDAPPRAFPTDDDRLARAYIYALHDSGAVAVMGRTKRESAAVPAFAFGVQAMGALLPRAPIDTVVLERWETVKDSTHAAGATKLVYGVRGGTESAQVDVVVEREANRPVVEGISVRRRP
jgi:hypothetical protein